MGEIHLAKDGELKREVAVKVGTVSEGAVDPRFTKEARVLANLAHPNIVPL
jgi:serine/threonine protein kinase